MQLSLTPKYNRLKQACSTSCQWLLHFVVLSDYLCNVMSSIFADAITYAPAVLCCGCGMLQCCCSIDLNNPL